MPDAPKRRYDLPPFGSEFAMRQSEEEKQALLGVEGSNQDKTLLSAKEMDDRARKKLQLYIKGVGRIQRFMPTSNIYRCFSLGFRHTHRDYCLVFFCVLIQLMGPAFVWDYSHRVTQGANYMPTYLYLQNITLQDLSKMNITATDENFFTELLSIPNSRKIVEMKLLGMTFVSAIFLTLDRRLLSMGTEVQNMIRFFYMEDSRPLAWLLLDVTCNGLCYLVIGLTIGTFLTNELSVLDLILDAVGLFFLANCDSLEGDLGYGTTNQHFLRVVKKAHKKWLHHKVRQHDFHKRPEGMLPSLLVHAIHMVCFTIRFLNQVIMCCQLPMFVFVTRVTTAADMHTYLSSSQGFEYVSPVWKYWPLWVVPAIILWSVFTIIRALWWHNVFGDANRHADLNLYEDDKHAGDCCRCICQVLFRQTDDRKRYADCIEPDLDEADSDFSSGDEHHTSQLKKIRKELRDGRFGSVLSLSWNYSSKARAKEEPRRSCELPIFSSVGR